MNPYTDSPLPPKPGAEMTGQEERTWAMLAHLSSLLLGFIGPLIVWLIYKDKSHFVGDQAKEALNFQLAVMIAILVTSPTCIGPLIVAVGALVYEIIAGIEANKGIVYRYPYTIRMIT